MGHNRGRNDPMSLKLRPSGLGSGGSTGTGLATPSTSTPGMLVAGAVLRCAAPSQGHWL